MNRSRRLTGKTALTWLSLFCFLFPMIAAASPQEKEHREKKTRLVLKEGTEVTLKFDQDVTSATAADDDKINFRLGEDLKVDKTVVAKEGAIAVGTVTHVRKRGHMGKAGELNVRLDYLKVGDTRVRLRAAKGKEGDSKVGATVALTVLFGPLGLLKRGHDIEIKKGTKLTAWVDQDTDVEPASE